MRRLPLLLALTVASAATASAQKTTLTGTTRVSIEVDGVMLGYGRSMTSLNASQLADYRAANAGGSALSHAPAGHPKGVDVEVDGVPMTGTTSPLLAWAQEAKDGRAQPRNVTLTLLNANGTAVIRYALSQAVPSKVTMMQLKAASTQNDAMNITFSAQGITASGGAAP